ncbi:SMC-Scp complex subunit ScpB [Candidatus Falkowbacteria bacterium CG10_big_fil_rev_8_21_14_0_10_37_14]|uniref:SMC-Scp complex subunit ScpB n=1 Tax=Candidatus Falkowbacteria bacterium CG10_big_fil_rev_8_21_14_0_10_37_14 TaxID=1974561 RepID=A0A2M6WTU5_9BACT|nr:SMC-Scp complex subunit ScpB [Candidatus Falkowbacteria bacterium]PIT96161.1 MAG: SMC-Scp complex subunit ScpB [Candidatus Falkowbacteria bacterium CG10_big_fil_rev_8_21_14_0_10_37_14]
MTLNSLLEALLFVSSKPLTAKRLAELSESEETACETALVELEEYYKTAERGLILVNNQGKWQLASNPEAAEMATKLVKAEVASELTRPSLEALTIIAYRGPLVKAELDKIRGVNCALILRNLLLRGLIESKEDKATNEIFYNVTFDFLRFLGLASLTELPDYERLNMEPALRGEREEDTE